jgi:hypothetical protein
MFDLQIKDLDSELKRLEMYEKQIPFVMAKTLTQTAVAVRGDLVEGIKKSFNNPTRYTLNSVGIITAKKSSLTSAVFIKDDKTKGNAASNYLSAQIFGGKRKLKPFERRLNRSIGLLSNKQFAPQKGRVNKHGNMTKGTIDKIVKGMGTSYIYVNNGKQRTGIYKKNKRSLRAMLYQIDNAQYTKRFDFFGISKQTIAQRLPLILSKNINELLNDPNLR